MEFAIRVTDRCNLNCAYCYARVADPKVMTHTTLVKVLAQINSFTKGGPVTISWTGGEPLTQDRKFFNNIAAMQQVLSANTFTNILQSNLILLDDWFVEFLKNHKWQVRTSLDLPPANHEELRRDGDFFRAYNSILRLRAAGIPVNVNTVITERNIHKAVEIYKALKQLNISSFSVSRMVDQGNAVEHPELKIYSNEDFGKFLVELFDLWMYDSDHTIERITPLDKLMAACKAGCVDPSSKCFHCQSQMFAIGPEGNVHPSCNKFFALPETCLGNVYQKDLKTIVDSQERKSFLSLTGDVSARVCGTCEYVKYCEGGCYYVAHNARIRNENMHTKETFCKGYYLVFKRILEYLQKENNAVHS